MSLEGGIRFGRYRFHHTQGLTRGKQDVRVTPKSLAVLRILLDRSGEVVTRDELFRAVWPDTAVSDAALTTCIQELRRVLADDARRPTYIETVHRRGFRFLPDALAENARSLDRTPHPIPAPTHAPLVGRDLALEELRHALTHARDGRRQTVFVTGEPGIGKTALVDVVLADVTEPVARAECVEHHGAGEAYQPLLDALTRLGTQPRGEVWVAAIRQCAPTWLAQLPALQSLSERQVLHSRAIGSTPERMLRELTDAVEMMSRRSPIVVCLEDLHWSDVSTLDWIVAFARRRQTARVLVIGTFRPGEAVSTSRSPEALAHDLTVAGLGLEIALPRLDAAAVTRYVMARCPPAGGAAPSVDRLATAVYRRTEGNPLFVVNALTDLAVRHVLVEAEGQWTAPDSLDESSLGIPADLRRIIERQIDRLDDADRQLLEVASLAGASCPAAAVAAGASVPLPDVEARFDGLARRHAFLRQTAPVEWPDGTLSGGFEFLHSLYREVLSTRPSPGRRAEVHRLIGTRLEAAYGDRAIELAAELALHFERGLDPGRALTYLQHAAETDRSRSAHHVAEQHYRRALALLERLPASPGRDEREIALRIGLGHVLMQTSGWGAPELDVVYARIRELAATRGSDPPLLSALWNLWIYSITRGELRDARDLADRLSAIAATSGDPDSTLQAHHAQWSTLFTLGDLPEAESHAREGLVLCQSLRRTTLAYGGHDTGVCARVFTARVLALQGRGDAAMEMCDAAERIARELEHPFTLAFTLMHAAAVHESLGDASLCRTDAAEARDLAREHGFNLMLGWATCFLGWAMSHLGEAERGLTLLEEGLAIARATGSVLFEPHLLGLLASAQHTAGRVTEALMSVEEALTVGNRTGERFYAKQLQRLRRELRAEGPPISGPPDT